MNVHNRLIIIIIHVSIATLLRILSFGCVMFYVPVDCNDHVGEKERSDDKENILNFNRL